MSKSTKLTGPPIEGGQKFRWHPETLWCSLKGHAVPAANVRTITDADSLVALPLRDGNHVARCLRCDMWLLTDETAAAKESVTSLSSLNMPQRGKALRDAIVLKVIAVDRGLHSVIFAIVFVGVLLIESHLGGLQSSARHLVDNAQNTLSNSGQGSSHSFVNKELNRFIDLKPGSLRVLLFTAAVYAVIEGLEAVGLWLQKRWAEYLTALATTGFLPLEIDELMKRITVLRVGALILNLAVLAYLLWAKRLFGIRGGGHEDADLIRTADQIHALPGQMTGSQASTP